MYMQSDTTWQIGRSPEAVLDAIAAATPRIQNPTTLRGVPRAQPQLVTAQEPPRTPPVPNTEHRYAKTIFGPAPRAPAVVPKQEVSVVARVTTSSKPRATEPSLLAITTPGFKRPQTGVDLDLGAARQTDRSARAEVSSPVEQSALEDYLAEPETRRWKTWLYVGGLLGTGGVLLTWLLL